MVLGLQDADLEHLRLLHAAGIHRYEQLSSVTPESLNDRLADANEREHRLRDLPSRNVLQQWIEQSELRSGPLPRADFDKYSWNEAGEAGMTDW
jgi:Domain of unknown function (DUF4332)